jgi:hypothetical protein
MTPPRDTIRVDWESMRAARLKYRAAVVKAEKQPGAPLVHTLYKLGQFLDEATHGAFRASEYRAPDTPEGLTS